MKAGDRLRRRLSEDERKLWRGITRSVAPLRPRARAADAEAETTAEAKATHAARGQGGVRDRGPDRGHAPARSAPPPKPTPKPPLEPFDRRLKRRLARGAETVDARIDLHGRTQREAHAALARFLRRAQADGARFVLVITGKGGRAREEWSERGVLKRQVPLWLQLPELRAYVAGFEDAHVGHGGEGALYVRIRRTDDRRRRTDD